MRRAKTRLELNVVLLYETIKMFYKHVSDKRRAEENLHPLLDAEGNAVTDEGKAEVSNGFLASVFTSKSSCAPGAQPSALDEGSGSGTERPREMGNSLRLCPHAHRCTGPEGPPRGLGELREAITRPRSGVYQQSWLAEESPVTGGR